ncbi:hypothetical protein Y032_0017g3274 [Ancylostoma ceylanicum]|uniref:G-protein coupled receptors family 1 profile domain-containing protein n=1 Tax=Ancylostoma ceylanicum TaxID=53326 RepID=A0A016V4A8_9BILA|nr:hypothetical protein Y032_0017g3274 [Ancylostoma ceylanicum]
MDFFLLTDVIVLVMQFLAIILNAAVIFILSRVKKDTASLRLVCLLALTDFIHAVAVLFYTIYLVCMWHPFRIDMNPYYVMISSTPLVIQLKINLTLTVAIALDRLLALYVPVRYRMISPAKFSAIALVVGFLAGICDLIIEFSLTPFRRMENCAAVGCFVDKRFLLYWGTSNMVLGVAVILLTFFVLVKLQQMKGRSMQSMVTPKNEGTKFAQIVTREVAVAFDYQLLRGVSLPPAVIKANRASKSFLLCSLVCLTIPSVVVGGAELFGFSLFQYVGPFYLVGLLCAGCSNCIVFMFFNTKMRAYLRTCTTKSDSGGWSYLSQRRGDTTFKSQNQLTHTDMK